MSDPLQKDEIEDVLSSIRRLVSDEVRAVVPSDAKAPEPKAQSTEKLVLTQSQRVEDGAAEPKTAQSALKQTQAAPAEDNSKPRVLSLGKSFTDMAEPSQTGALEVSSKDAPSEDSFGESQAQQSKQAEPVAGKTAENVADKVASEWQSVRAQPDGLFDPDDSEDGDYAGTEVGALDWRQSTKTEPRAPLFSKPVQPQPAPKESFSADPVIEGHVVPSPSKAEASQEAVLDEDMLRDLVGEIVRQELQGPLGERITRNVRKLVRREINRALAARDLD